MCLTLKVTSLWTVSMEYSAAAAAPTKADIKNNEPNLKITVARINDSLALVSVKNHFIVLHVSMPGNLLVATNIVKTDWVITGRETKISLKSNYSSEIRVE